MDGSAPSTRLRTTEHPNRLGAPHGKGFPRAATNRRGHQEGCGGRRLPDREKLDVPTETYPPPTPKRGSQGESNTKTEMPEIGERRHPRALAPER